MGLGAGNALWMDLLENGPSARSAKFFDVEWRPVKEELADKVLLPVLGDRYGAVLERGEIQLELDEGAFRVRYYDHLFPLNPRSYAQILAYRIEELERALGKSEPVDELKSILFVLEHMPSRHEQDPARREERWREKEVVKRRVATLFARSEPVRRHLEENVRIFNGTKEKPRSFDLLDKLLDAQAYRLAHWRVSSEEINYRRFFDINSLAAVRMEDPDVFEQAHRLPLRLTRTGSPIPAAISGCCKTRTSSSGPAPGRRRADSPGTSWGRRSGTSFPRARTCASIARCTWSPRRSSPAPRPFRGPGRSPAPPATTSSTS